MGRLSGRTALIVGASRGFGRAIALGYAREGANVIGVSRDPRALDALAQEIAPLGVEVVTRAFDATAPGAYPDLVEWLTAGGHGYDVVVHTPGGGLHALAVSDQRVRAQLMEGQGQVPFWEIEDEDMDRVLALGVKSAINCCKYLAPALIRQGRGSLVVMGSASGIPGQAVNADAAYCAEKGAVISYVLVISRELKPYGVAANVLLPGLTRTTITAGYPHWEAHPTILSPEAAVPAAIFLAEQTADGVTGQIFNARDYLVQTQNSQAGAK